MELDDYLKSKVRFHLGFNAGAQIPAGDRSRLEEAMAMTRKQAANDGAAKGSRLTLDKLKNSPTTRRQVGIR